MASSASVDLKVVFLGSAGAGKTSILLRYVKDQFTSDAVATIGVAFQLHTWRDFKLALWDTAGQERFAALANMYCRNAGAAILVYDVTDRQSFVELESKFLEYLRDANSNCVKIVAANKVDLVQDGSNQRQVSAEEGEQFARRIQAVAYLETSAKTNKNINEIFDSIGLFVFRDQLARRASSPTTKSHSRLPSSASPTQATPSSYESAGTVEIKPENERPYAKTDSGCCK